MAYQLDLTHPAPEEFRRVALEELRTAQAHLKGGDVHQARRTLKQLRALFHLAGGPTARRYLGTARDTARLLSETRDHAVCRTTLERLGKPDAAIRAALAALGPTPPLPASVQPRALKALTRLRSRVTRWKPDATRETVFRRLRKTYRKTRRMLNVVEVGGDEEAFHELRKGFKRLWAQLRLLPSVRHPKRRKDAIAACDAIAEILGDEHDLAVLQDRLDRLGLPHPARLSRKRLQTQKDAVRLARDFLAGKPRATLTRWYGKRPFPDRD